MSIHKLFIGGIRCEQAKLLGRKTIEIQRLTLSVETYKAKIKRADEIASEEKTRATTFATLSAHETITNTQVDAMKRKVAVR